ncbi:MAG: tetratricopeptide repeat protein [Reyranella sp.]
MTFKEALEIASGPPSPDDRFIEACTVVATALESKAHYKVEALVSRAIGYMLAQQHAKALSDLDEAVRLNPNFDRAYVNRAALYSMLCEDQMALPDFNRSIDLNPTNPIAYAGRGQLLRRLGLIDEAIADVAMARAFDEGNPHIERLWEQLLDESWKATPRPN